MTPIANGLVVKLFFIACLLTNCLGAFIGVSTPLSRSAASTFCQDVYDGQLAKVDSFQDALAVRQAITDAGDFSSERVWIGLNALVNFEWEDGETFNDSLRVYSNSNETQDQDPPDFCMSFDSSRSFIYEPCADELLSVCEVPVASYIGVNLQLNYTDASLYCEDVWETNLAVIRNDEEDAASKAAAIASGVGSRFWLGLDDREVEDEFVWINDDPSGYRNWRPNEPNDFRTGQDCGISTSNRWDDVSCTNTEKFVCNMPSNPPTLAPSDVTLIPTAAPSDAPTTSPTGSPSEPTVPPSAAPSVAPSTSPTAAPSEPTLMPSDWPTRSPTIEPTSQPTVSVEDFIAVDLYLNYSTASDYCASNFGTHVAVIRNSEENEAVQQAARDVFDSNNTEIWIGLVLDYLNQNDSVWANGDPSDYRNWQPGSPNLANYDYCVIMKSNDQWDDTSCSSTFRFVCNAPYPTAAPTDMPIVEPTIDPTIDPTIYPTIEPSIEPTFEPTVIPSPAPTVGPTNAPTLAPIAAPSGAPTGAPSPAPTSPPTIAPGVYIGVKSLGKVSYTTADDHCQSTYGTRLATIRSEADNQAVRDAALAAGIANWAYIWIGLNDIDLEDDYTTWNDGQSVVYTRWKQFQPNNNNGNEDCVVQMNANNGYLWNDVKCSNNYWFVCNDV